MSHKATLHPLVVLRILRICEIEDDRRVRLRATAVSELAAEVDATIETQAAIVQNVDVECFEVSWRVDDADLARLHEIVRHN